MGEDLWAQLLDLVGWALPSWAVQPEEAIPEVCEALEDDTAEPEEILGRYYVPLDLPETIAEDLEVRDWPRAWDEERIWGDMSPEEREQLVALKARYKRLGADQVKIREYLSLSALTIRKIWWKEGISSRRRRKKHRTKRNLGEMKSRWRLFQQIDEDTKDLCNIPEYYLKMKSLGLPTIQYTARDVATGLLFMGFAQERSLTNSVPFAEYLNQTLRRYGVDLDSEDLDDLLSEWQHHYNWHRPHGSLGGKSPMDRFFELIHKTPLREEVETMCVNHTDDRLHHSLRGHRQDHPPPQAPQCHRNPYNQTAEKANSHG